MRSAPVHDPRSSRAGWSPQAKSPPPERSYPLNGENLIYQVRELRRNPLWSCAVPVGSRSFASRPLAVEPPTGKKHEGCAPSYSAAGESHLHPGKQVCRLYKNSMVQVVSDSERKIPEKIPRSVATVYFNCILYRFGTNAIQAVFQDFFTEWHIFRE